MFEVQLFDTMQRIVTLDGKWKGKEETLRSLAKEDRVVCKKCLGLVWFRYKEMEGKSSRRPHFSHRAEKGCQLGKRTAGVLEAQAVLYEWLEEKYPEQVELDGEYDGFWAEIATVTLRRDDQQNVVYWILEKGFRNAEYFMKYLEDRQNGSFGHVVITSSEFFFEETSHYDQTVNKAKKMITLTPTMRCYITSSKYDDLLAGQCFSKTKGHLTILYPELKELLILRRLSVLKCNRNYSWEWERRAKLGDVLLDDINGELIVEADLDQLQLFMKLQEPRQLSQPTRVQSLLVELRNRKQHADQRQNDSPLSQNTPLQCEHCGVMTINWVSAVPYKGTCVCRDCGQRK